jgi:uncharacterized protein
MMVEPATGWGELLSLLDCDPAVSSRTGALRAVPGYVERVLGDDPGGHDWWHAERVARSALAIARHEDADEELCIIAAAVHDLVDYKVVEDESEAAKDLRRWLAGRGLTDSDVEHVLNIAITLSFNGGHGPTMATLEGAVVQDADRLDSLGAIGLARSLAFGGTIGRPLHRPGVPLRTGMSSEEYRSHVSTSINHIRERLLVLPDRLNTAYARRLAGDREAFVVAFLAQFEDEWHGRR